MIHFIYYFIVNMESTSLIFGRAVILIGIDNNRPFPSSCLPPL